ncbi:MAG: hypothetical protein AAGJ93_03405, partial [Bacteroidota bacterium]
FGLNNFLLVITVLSAYLAFSGYRCLQFKTNIPRELDIFIAILSMVVLSYYLYYMKSIGMMWAPVVIYSTVGALFLVIAYDFLRYLIPQASYKRRRIWLYEHIYKMTNAFGALLSAFSGTVLEAYKPHSQYLPSVFILLIVIGFMIYVNKYGLKKWSRSA